MTILALDLGASCGWAVGGYANPVSGVWKLTPPARCPDRTKELRLVRKLEEARTVWSVTAIAYELVHMAGRPQPCRRCGAIQQVANMKAAHAYGAYQGIVQMFADLHRLEVYPVAVGTLKKHATGSGRASKAEMLAAAQAKWGEVVKNHDQADALHVLDWCMVR